MSFRGEQQVSPSARESCRKKQTSASCTTVSGNRFRLGDGRRVLDLSKTRVGRMDHADNAGACRFPSAAPVTVMGAALGGYLLVRLF